MGAQKVSSSSEVCQRHDSEKVKEILKTTETSMTPLYIKQLGKPNSSSKRRPIKVVMPD